LTDATFFEAVEACLSEAPIDGLCEEYGLSSTKYGVMPKWDVSRVTNMRGFDGLDFTGFGDKDTFNSDISRWKTSRVTNMEYMFIYASSFNQDLSVWDTSSVTSMSHMLYEAASFKYDIASWEVSSVADFGNMLYGATAFQERFVCSDANEGPPGSCVQLTLLKPPPSSPPPPLPPPPLFLTSLVADATQPKLYASDAAADDKFGMCVSLNEDTALIGSVLDDDNGVSNSGSVYIFTRSSADGTFTQQSKLYASDAAASDLFGHLVSLYGNTALIGAHSDDDNGVSDSGSVYVFTRSSSDGTFAQQAKLTRTMRLLLISLVVLFLCTATQH
jgi:surface protein